jgi:hypothetical protein
MSENLDRRILGKKYRVSILE